MKNLKTCIVVFAALTAHLAHAQIADDARDWPSVVPTPILDVPMRDAAITRGPDSMYYLTGTLAAEDGARRQPLDLKSTILATTASKNPDFDNCRVIKLWRSSDLKTWEDLGVVWDMKEDVFGARGDRFYPAIQYQREARYAPGPQGYDTNLGCTEPELHFIKGDWYICYSISGHGTALLKSESGKPSGPYALWGHITFAHGSPSMFWDKKDEFGGDDAVYWLFGGGWIAKMTDDLKALAEPPTLIRPQHERPPAWAKAPTFFDHPLSVGSHGVFLFKHRGRYYVTAGDWTHRLGTPCDDTYLAYADSPRGPWSRRHLMIPHGGGITVFQGPRNSAVPRFTYPQQAFYLGSVSKIAKPATEVEKAKNDLPFYATFFGHDDRAIFRDRPSFIPLEWTGPQRPVYGLHDDCESFPRKPQHVFTERGPWPWMKPALQGLKMRDVSVRKMPDGYLVLSGSIYGQPKELCVYRSKDMLHWEKVGPVWTYDQIEWLPVKLPLPALKPGDTPWQHTFWDTQVLFWKGTYYIAFDIFMRDDHPEHRGCGVLKSTTGKLEGPYISLGKVGGQLGKDSGPIMPNFFEGSDGKLYAKNWLNWKQVVAEADLDVPGWKWDYKPVDGGVFKHRTRMDPFGIEGVAGKILFMTAGNGPGGWTEENSYDVNYVTAATPWGPVISERMRVIPHAAAANCFQDNTGKWWRICFGSDATGPWNDMLGFLPLRVEHSGEELIVDVEVSPDEHQKRIMGGGAVAEVKTVGETVDSPR